MQKIEIPDELVEHIEAIQCKKELVCKPGASFYGDRKTLLDTLRKLDTPSDAEKKLLDELTVQERDAHLHSHDVEQMKKEIYSHYERVRQIARDMFRGRFLIYYREKVIVYIYVTKVSMHDRGDIWVTGNELIIYKETGRLGWTCSDQYSMFCCDDALYSSNIEATLRQSLEHMFYTDKTEIVNKIKNYKKTAMQMYDDRIKLTESMDQMPFPEDEPAHPEKWW